ncbi:trimethylamine methyltransferase family protein [Emergencia sp.]|uniref:trimethylamine methyltransferase family protein n=1 Tax=Emergencia sp. TaxID=1926557 RepID=UPI003AF0E3BF
MELAKNLTVLSEDEVYKIHMNVMEVLWQVGILVEEEQSLKLLEKNGAKVDYNLQRAYIPAELVQQALQTKSHSYAFYDVFGKKAFQFGGKESTYATAGYATTYIDKDGVEHAGTYEAALRHAKLMEVMNEVGVQQPAIQPCDMPAELQDLYMYKASLVGTKKPIHSVANSEKSAEAIINMNAEMVGGLDNLMKKPRLMFNLCTFSPLGIRRDGCEVIRMASKYDIPCIFSTGTMAGATAPVTLAGSLIQSFAEVIGHVVLAQCYRPGMRVGLLHASRIFDMKFAACTVATPEYPIIKMGAMQMARFYNIPTVGIGISADSNECDAQYGWETFMNGFIARQSGMNVINGLGTFSQLNGYSFERTVIDGEIVRVIERICRGMEVNDFSMAFDVIEEEGVKAEFLYNPHTTGNFRSEFMIPILTDRAPYANYVKREGKNTLLERAAKQLDKYEQSYNYTYGLEKEEALQKIIDEYAKTF